MAPWPRPAMSPSSVDEYQDFGEHYLSQEATNWTHNTKYLPNLKLQRVGHHPEK